MKYRDVGFIKVQERQDNERNGLGFIFKSDRKLRRENDLKFSKFYIRHLSKNIDKDWWDCLGNDNKDKIYKSYFDQKEMIENHMDLTNAFASLVFYNSWDEWFDHLSKVYTIDKVKYREMKLKKLGI